MKKIGHWLSFFVCLALLAPTEARAEDGGHESVAKAAVGGFFHGLTHPVSYWFPPAPYDPYYGSSFNQVWNTVQEGPYSSLPHYEVGPNLTKLAASAVRTIRDRNDILPYFQKFVHADGMCLAGTWQIDGNSPYTGLYAPGSKALIVARASLAAGNPNQGHYRAFGLAGKLFNTTDPNKTVETADFFTLNDATGNKDPYYTEESFTNRPPVTPNGNLFSSVRLAGETFAALRWADSHVGERQLYEVAEDGVSNLSQARTPYQMQLKAAPGQDISRSDFRSELLAHKQLTFDISVRDSKTAAWTNIGKVVFTRSTAAAGCDHRLHFHHLGWRKDLP